MTEVLISPMSPTLGALPPTSSSVTSPKGITATATAATTATAKEQDPAYWEQLVNKNITSRSLNNMEMYLGQMGLARAVKILRTSRNKVEKEAVLALLCIEMHRPDEEIVELYTECKRYDLLVNYFVATGKFEKALDTATKYSRFQLKSTHFQFARYLESKKEHKLAAHHYEKSGNDNIVKEIPRMYFDANMMPELEEYISTHKTDPQLCHWWASYQESLGHLEMALAFYQLAKDVVAVVRLCCLHENWKKAEECVQSSQNSAASAFFAHQLERAGQFTLAIKYFLQSKKYADAVRLAMKENLQMDVIRIAYESRIPSIINMSAKWFEDLQLYEKAVNLYEKTENFNKAIELCLRENYVDSLERIIDNCLEINTFQLQNAEKNPVANQQFSNGLPATPIMLSLNRNLLQRCANVLLSLSNIDKAIALYLIQNNYSAAVQLCVEKNLFITEELAEKLTPIKPKSKGDAIQERETILNTLGRLTLSQHSYHLSCKKYTQAGNSMAAVKALFKSENIDKIIYYATMSKKVEIYNTVANYLSTCNWKASEVILKNIIFFYNKAKNWKSLSHFYEVCSQVEIDEFRDYEKAAEALKESISFLLKSENRSDNVESNNDDGGMMDKDNQVENRLKLLRFRYEKIKEFIAAKSLLETNFAKSYEICMTLITHPHIESALRAGDVFALLIEFYGNTNQWQSAYDHIQKMYDAHIDIEPYLDEKLIHLIFEKVGRKNEIGLRKAVSASRAGVSSSSLPVDDEVEDNNEIEEEI